MTDVRISRLQAALSGRYSVQAEVGEGGMATVYLAEDLKHRRKVALKVLRPELAAVVGADRFLAEIETTANLQHPHILPLYDSGEADSFLFYVMPYVEGDTLRQRLDREKQLPVDEALRIATAVAGALDYAHRRGVIHRDIKPENILLHDGQPLVADFGIALAVSSAGGARMTETGMSVGTPHYMSPEQAMGDRDVDARSDVYALGAMLYEMLAGEPPFTGPTAQAIVAKVLTSTCEPVTTYRRTTPQHVSDAIGQALERLPADRFARAADFAAALEGTLPATGAAGGRRIGVSRSVPTGNRVFTWGGWAMAVLAVAFTLWGRIHAETRPLSRFTVGFAAGRGLDLSGLGTHLAVSPDGATIVYTGVGAPGGQLWMKARDDLAPSVIPGSQGAFDPFFSPDGREIGFVSDFEGRALKVVSLSGGVPRTVTGQLGQSGATWASDGYIYFDANTGGLQRIRPDGTGLETVMPLDTTTREVGVAWPKVLPGNRVAIVRVRRETELAGDFRIVAVRIATGERADVVPGVSARYQAGHLLFVTADGTLQAAPFDEGALALAGPAIPLARDVRVAGTYAGADFDSGRDGTLYYVAGAPGLASRLQWVARDGTTAPVDTSWHESGDIRGVALSPDGRRVALELARGGTGIDIWIKELPTGPLRRLTEDPTPDTKPSWSPDGHSVLFLAERIAPTGVFLRRADGAGTDSLILQTDQGIDEAYPSRDGRWLLLDRDDDIAALEMGGDGTLRTLVATPAPERSPQLSPDGRWLAYASSASGRWEVYVRPFPGVDGGLWQISADGGVEPRWAHSGREIFFRDLGSLDMMVANVGTTPTFQHGPPRTLFRTDAVAGFNYVRYDVSPDDRLFLMVGRGDTGEEPTLVRIENFLEAVKAGS
jgi:Tol biopolymer transport system component